MVNHPIQPRTTASSTIAGRAAPYGQLASLHGLRLIAALMVLFNHALIPIGPPAWAITHVTSGAAGVDIFFVISGFVIGLSGGRESPLTYLLRRAIRVLPLYWFATLLSCPAKAALFGNWPTTRELLCSFLLVPSHGGL